MGLPKVTFPGSSVVFPCSPYHTVSGAAATHLQSQAVGIWQENRGKRQSRCRNCVCVVSDWLVDH